jgi:hypothetical protein
MAIWRLCVIVAFFCAGASAQWLHYPTPGVPRTADGKPNLSAPAPRTADGKPDLSGIWEDDTGKAPQSCYAGDCEDSSDPPKGTSPLASNVGWVDFGARLPGGLPYQPWAAEEVKRRKVDYGKDDPPTHCMPLGAPRMLVDPLYRKFVRTPGLLVILNERDAGYRQIFTDGRPLPQDPQPSWNGYSTGKWEGDTLVVQTNGLRDGIWLDRNGSPMTDAAKLTERFRRVNYGTMEIEVTVDDPKAYTRPWTVKVIEFIVLNTELLDSLCLENEKDAVHLVGK